MNIDDTSFQAIIVVVILVFPPIAGFSFGGFGGGLSMIFLSLICLPVVMFLLGIGMFKRHDDIYG